MESPEEPPVSPYLGLGCRCALPHLDFLWVLNSFLHNKHLASWATSLAPLVPLDSGPCLRSLYMSSKDDFVIRASFSHPLPLPIFLKPSVCSHRPWLSIQVSLSKAGSLCFQWSGPSSRLRGMPGTSSRELKRFPSSLANLQYHLKNSWTTSTPSQRFLLPSFACCPPVFLTQYRLHLVSNGPIFFSLLFAPYLVRRVVWKPMWVSKCTPVGLENIIQSWGSRLREKHPVPWLDSETLRLGYLPPCLSAIGQKITNYAVSLY